MQEHIRQENIKNQQNAEDNRRKMDKAHRKWAREKLKQKFASRKWAMSTIHQNRMHHLSIKHERENLKHDNLLENLNREKRSQDFKKVMVLEKQMKMLQQKRELQEIDSARWRDHCYLTG